MKRGLYIVFIFYLNVTDITDIFRLNEFIISEDGSECLKLDPVSSRTDYMGEGSSWILYPAGRIIWEKDQSIEAGSYIQQDGLYGRRIRALKLDPISSRTDYMGEGSNWVLYPAGSISRIYI